MYFASIESNPFVSLTGFNITFKFSFPEYWGDQSSIEVLCDRPEGTGHNWITEEILFSDSYVKEEWVEHFTIVNFFGISQVRIRASHGVKLDDLQVKVRSNSSDFQFEFVLTLQSKVSI